MAHPAIDTGFARASELQTYLERVRAHALAGEAGYRTAAAELKHLIRDQGHRFNPNARLQAVRITKPLVHAAELQVDTARMSQLCLDLFRGAFPPVDASTGARRTFDPYS